MELGKRFKSSRERSLKKNPGFDGAWTRRNLNFFSGFFSCNFFNCSLPARINSLLITRRSNMIYFIYYLWFKSRQSVFRFSLVLEKRILILLSFLVLVQNLENGFQVIFRFFVFGCNSFSKSIPNRETNNNNNNNKKNRELKVNSNNVSFPAGKIEKWKWKSSFVLFTAQRTTTNENEIWISFFYAIENRLVLRYKDCVVRGTLRGGPPSTPHYTDDRGPWVVWANLSFRSVAVWSLESASSYHWQA